ncbi:MULTISPECIES: hypothetical protein [unclassified Xanthobacter]|uniref:hypothetical protein n=1 Tax=unclassified Xanthobacter TaxID=2623496 RepID=UPI001EE0AB96|nr:MULTISPECIES: hypothetical protein [unclassified Xanthobacter]
MEPLTAPELIFHAVRNAQYHTARRRSLERWNRYATALSVLLGGAVMVDVAGKAGLDIVWIGAATAVVGVAQLVFDFAGRARIHETLQRRYYDLLAAMRRAVAPDTAELAEWNATLAQIYGDEPPVEPIADAIAYNAAGNALGMEASESLVIPFRLRFFALLGAGASHRFETRAERQARRDARPWLLRWWPC